MGEDASRHESGAGDVRLEGKTTDHGRAGSELRLAFAILTALFMALFALSRRNDMLGDPDIWWHTRVGAWIWQNGRLPTTDSFSHSFAGQPWIAKEWLSQLLFFWSYDAAGWTGTALLAELAVVAAGTALYWALSESLPPVRALGVTVLALFLASPAILARPHVLSLAPAIIWTHQMFRAAAAGRAPHPALLLVLMLWANLHGAFTLGFVIAALAGLEAFLKAPRDRGLLMKWLVFLALCPLAAMAHPYGWNAILATWWFAGGNEAMPLVAEWQPFDAPAMWPQELALLALLLAGLLSGVRLSPARALLVVLLLHMALTHARFVFFLFALMPVAVVPVLVQQFRFLSADSWRAARRDGLETWVLRAGRPLLACLCACLLGVGLLQAMVLRSTPPAERALAGALGAAKAMALTGHVFNAYDFGGILIFNDIPTFIDGRAEQLFQGGFTTTFMSGPHDLAGLAAAFATYDIAWTLLPPGDPRNQLIAQLPGWKRVYEDANAVIYRRTGTPP